MVLLAAGICRGLSSQRPAGIQQAPRLPSLSGRFSHPSCTLREITSCPQLWAFVVSPCVLDTLKIPTLMPLGRRNNPKRVKAGCGQYYSKTLLGTLRMYPLDRCASSTWHWLSPFSGGLKRGLEMNILSNQCLDIYYLHELDQVAQTLSASVSSSRKWG